MLQHDERNGKFYNNGAEISKEEYDALYAEWRASIPPIDPQPEPDDIDEAEAFDIIFGGGAE